MGEEQVSLEGVRWSPIPRGSCIRASWSLVRAPDATFTPAFLCQTNVSLSSRCGRDYSWLVALCPSTQASPQPL